MRHDRLRIEMEEKMKASGTVFKYGDNVDTDVIIPARYLNSSDPKELAAHCMEDFWGWRDGSEANSTHRGPMSGNT